MSLCAAADFVDGTFGAGHITNYAQNENGDVWSLQQLAAHLGSSVWKVRQGVHRHWHCHGHLYMTDLPSH